MNSMPWRAVLLLYMLVQFKSYSWLIMSGTLSRKGTFALREGMNSDPELEAYMARKVIRPWAGTRDMLPRRGQVPSNSQTPRDVVKICCAALQNNDDPQLDHGACVVLEFRSPNGFLSENSLDPAQYGAFLRSEFPELVDFKTAEFVGEPMELTDSLSVKQVVRIVPWGSSPPATFNFFLSKVRELWLLDVILKDMGDGL